MLTSSTTARKFTALALACALSTNTMAMSMQELFDSVNAQGNVSTPSVVQGQTMNMLSGGSLFMRMPRRTYNLASFTPPSYSAGCGGIDLFAGGFSFINKEQFVALLRNIGSNALGYGFKVAIQNLCPTCDNVMQALQATAQAMNRLNVDSCEVAKGIVNAGPWETLERDQTTAAKMFGVDGGYFADVTEAWTEVGKSFQKTKEQIKKTAEDKPEIKDSLPMGNVTWNALKKVDGLSDDYKMIIMSMVGTVIFPIEGDITDNMIIIPPQEITIKTLVGGNVVDADGRTMEKIKLPIWKCTVDTVECLIVNEEILEVDSFQAMIRTKLQKITDHIASRSAYSGLDSDIWSFLGATDIPVYKMLAVATSLDNTKVADQLINRYQELLAAKYAEVYIERAAKDLRTALAKYSAQSSTSSTQAMEVIDKRIGELNQNARNVMATAYAQTVSTFNIAQEVAYMERAMTANLSGTLRASLNYSKSLR